MPKVYGKNVDSPAMHRVAADEKGRLRAQVAILPESLKGVRRFPQKLDTWVQCRCIPGHAAKGI